jgi:hypothetical protein
LAKGRRTQRSQNYLHQYGYPSNRKLRREAKNVARASVPTVRSIQRPYNRQIQSARDFLQAVQGALADVNSGVNASYDQALSQQQAVSDAAQARLAGLGLGVDAAGTQAAAGASGDSAAAQLISNAGSARNYAAKLPGIAAGSALVDQAGLRKQMLDALQNRRDQMRQAYFPALESARSAALQRAGFNQSQDQFLKNLGLQRAQMAQQASQFAQSFGLQQQQYGEGVREFNIQQKNAAKQQAWSNKLDIAKFEASTGYNPITGKAVAGASSSLSQFSPSELRQQAKLAAPFLNPTRTQSVTSSAKGPSGTKSTNKKVVIHDPPLPLRGMPFQQFLAQLTDAGVNPQIALRMAAGLYQRYANPEMVLAELNSMRSAEQKPLIGSVSGVSPQILHNAQLAYASFVHYARQVGLMSRHDPYAGNYGEGGRSR